MKQNYNLTIKFLILILLNINISNGQNFNKVPSTIDLKGAYIGLATFVDYNNDGLLDIFETGLDFGNNGDFKNAILYKNNGDETFTESSIKNIPRNVYSSCSWGDFNNDGTLDLIYCGTLGGPEYNMTKVYKNINNGCEFIEIQTSIPKISSGTVKWVDVNNDGFLDVFYQGTDINGDYDSGIYKNNGNETFTKIANSGFYNIKGNRANLQFNRVEWGDFDGDGLKDAISASSTKTEREFAIYKNLGNFKFEKVNFNLPQLSYISMDVGDINHDGLLDFVFTGSPKFDLMSGDSGTKLYFYINNGNMNFSNSFTLNNDGVFLSDIKLGDFNNDGYPDLMNYGSGLSYRNTKFYLNNKNGTFTFTYKPFPDCYSGGIDFGDYDNDDDLDILYYGRISNPYDDEITYIYENKTTDIEFPSKILFNRDCACNLNGSFSLNNSVDNVKWNFDDITTGSSNQSTLSKPLHTFSKTGIYTISATYTKGTQTETLSKTISIIGPPEVTQPTDIFTCNENEPFNFHLIKDKEILKNLPPEDYEINYYLSQNDANNKKNELPNSVQLNNTTDNIFIRIQNKSNSNCYVIKNFKISFLTPQNTIPIEDIYVCDSNKDGFGLFDLSNIETQIINNQSSVKVEFYDSSNNLIAKPLNANYKNIIKYKDYITAKVSNISNSCTKEIQINLIVSPLPTANDLDILVGCDDNNDGISEYFDTSKVESQVLCNQTELKINYFDNNGNQLPSPLPNPYTNTTVNKETITVRVTNPKTNCYSDAKLNLVTSTKPLINQPQDLFACDEGSGFGQFNTSSIENQIIVNQKGLQLSYSDENGNKLPSPLPTNFKNTIAWSQTIKIRVENQLNPLCFSETTLKLIINKLPDINLEETYSLCDLEPSLKIAINPNYNSYEWKNENNLVISNTFEATLTDSGKYTAFVYKLENGITCKNLFSFNLVRSLLPKITDVLIEDFSDNNSIEIKTQNSENLEFSIDGIHFQDNNIFYNVEGGIYNAQIRDKKGCGINEKEITVLDYPKFFTPNHDGYNDYWHIKGIQNFTNSNIIIYDRYGKLLKRLTYNDKGWDGNFNGEQLPSTDYWFSIDLGNGRNFKGHFSLKR